MTRCPACGQVLPGLRKPRSTGPRSQNSRHWGHCEDLAGQLSTTEHTYTKADIDAALRRMSVSEGLRTQLTLDGIEEPIHASQLTSTEAELVERVKQRFADIHGLWLTEYDESVSPPVPYKSIGGRSRAEMDTYRRDQ